ncbi:MAG: hypothetical protein M0R06_04595 [Sphaerochaeta sp.]|jgi:hypothetical protein|nr:hypothetical protein [Sphaerochaeta sp.]
MNDLTREVLGCLTDVIAEVAENHRLIRCFEEDPYFKHARSISRLHQQNENLARVVEALCSALCGIGSFTEHQSDEWEKVE